MAVSRKKAPAKKGAAGVTGAACGCGPVSAPSSKFGTPAGEPAAVRDGVGPGAHAAGVDNALKAANIKHLRRIEGQVRGLAGMVEEDRYCADIITQVSAVRESLQTVARNLMRNHLRHCAAKAMHDEGMTREAMVDELMELVAKLRT
ncbi:MAG: metal-sensitive transcriptional regulator [Phycisphaerae bacterium]|nr:metal-sensitive transcriptional regulator [Phycisphaerae bacterium]